MNATEPDATLVFLRGECVVMSAAQIDHAHDVLVIARRDDFPALAPGSSLSDQRLDALAHCLDNVVRDLGS